MESVYNIGSFAQRITPHRDIGIPAEYASQDLQEPLAEKDQGRNMLGDTVNIPYESLALDNEWEPDDNGTQSKEQCEP